MKIRSFILLLLILPTISVAKPKLVINIVVGQMRYDYLLRYNDNFSDDGFIKLLNHGAFCDRATYNYLNTSTPTGLATISTGTDPSIHGIIGTHWFNYSTSLRISLIHDPIYTTIGSKEANIQASPRGMIVGTLGDALKSISPQSKVISLAFEPTSAIIMGGYSADAAYWLSPRDGNIVSSTYYQSTLPDWVTKYNNTKYAETYSASKWIAKNAPSSYKNIFCKDILMEDNGDSFDFVTRKKYDYERFAATPFANTMLKELATQTIIYEYLGKGNHTDMLNIVYDPMRLIGEKYGTNSLELEDAYYRFDEELGSFIAFLESHIGKDNFLIIVTSDHGASDPVIESSKFPGGRFNTEQFTMLINGFVGGLLGDNGRWVLDFSNNQIYLNRRLMLEKGVDVLDVQNKIAAFAIQFRGVAQAITSNALNNSHFSDGVMNKAQNSYHQRHSGDIIINLLPGWTNNNGKLSDSGSPYNYDIHVPLIWYGGTISPQRITRDVNITDIAPTTSHIIEISPPNASTGRSITEIYVKHNTQFSRHENQ